MAFTVGKNRLKSKIPAGMLKEAQERDRINRLLGSKKAAAEGITAKAKLGEEELIALKKKSHALLEEASRTGDFSKFQAAFSLLPKADQERMHHTFTSELAGFARQNNVHYTDLERFSNIESGPKSEQVAEIVKGAAHYSKLDAAAEKMNQEEARKKKK